MIVIWCASVCALFVAVALLALKRMLYWRRQGENLQEIGYIPPAPTWIERRIYYWLSRVLLRVVLGPIKVLGQENTRFDGRLVILGNHQHGLDFITLRAALTRRINYWILGAAKEATGKRKAIAAFISTIVVPAVNGKSIGHSDVVIQNLAHLLANNRNAKVLLFPQGKLVLDNVLQAPDFRTGAIQVMALVDKLTNHDKLAALPVVVHYWTECERPTLLRRSMISLWLKTFGSYNTSPKYGATVIIGKPIPFSELPEEPRDAIEHVCTTMQALLDEAKNQSP